MLLFSVSLVRSWPAAIELAKKDISFLAFHEDGTYHDDVIKWKHFLRYWPFVRGIHWSPVNSPHKGQWSGALMFSLNCAWINGLVSNQEAGNLRRHRVHYDVRQCNAIRCDVEAWYRMQIDINVFSEKSTAKTTTNRKSKVKKLVITMVHAFFIGMN